jgi:hypothetical protein
MHSNTSSPSLATRFARNTYVLRSETPLAEDQMRQAAPSIFASGKHASRSERYTYVPTIEVLRGLRKEGFEPFMVAQGGSRVEGKAEFTKHLIRMRHAGQASARPEAPCVRLVVASPFTRMIRAGATQHAAKSTFGRVQRTSTEQSQVARFAYLGLGSSRAESVFGHSQRLAQEIEH